MTYSTTSQYDVYHYYMSTAITFNIQCLFQYNLHSLYVVLVPDGIQKLVVLSSELKYIRNHLVTKAERNIP